MKRNEPSLLDRGHQDDDLGRRVARYRARLEAEGRLNSIEILDQAMREGRGFGQGAGGGEE